MERLNIDDDTEVALLDEAIKLAAAEKEALEAAVAEQEERVDKLAKKHSSGCHHGHVDTDDRLSEQLHHPHQFFTTIYRHGTY